MDLSTLTDEQLDARRVAVLTEQERRRKLADLPDDLAAMGRDAVAAGWVCLMICSTASPTRSSPHPNRRPPREHPRLSLHHQPHQPEPERPEPPDLRHHDPLVGQPRRAEDRGHRLVAESAPAPRRTTS